MTRLEILSIRVDCKMGFQNVPWPGGRGGGDEDCYSLLTFKIYINTNVVVFSYLNLSPAPLYASCPAVSATRLSPFFRRRRY